MDDSQPNPFNHHQAPPLEVVIPALVHTIGVEKFRYICAALVGIADMIGPDETQRLIMAMGMVVVKKPPECKDGEVSRLIVMAGIHDETTPFLVLANGAHSDEGAKAQVKAIRDVAADMDSKDMPVQYAKGCAPRRAPLSPN